MEAATAAARALKETPGDDVLAVYLHGSAALGGFRWDRSDLDLLALSHAPLNDRQVSTLGDALTRVSYPANGLEFSLMTEREAWLPKLPTPRFQVHVTTEGWDRVARLVDGRARDGDPDLVLHLAVCRARGLAVMGPPPRATLADVADATIVVAMRAELEWARSHAPLEYLVLTSARVWLFAETRRIASKIEAGEWAAQRYPESGVIEAALARQRGAGDEIQPEAAQRLATYVESLTLRA